MFEKLKDAFTNKNNEPVSLKDETSLLISKLDARIDDAKSVRKSKLQQWKKYLEFFIGDHWKATGITLPSYKANISINKIFAAIRSLVAYETDTKPTPIVDARITQDIKQEKKDLITKASKKVESMLDYKWDYRQIPNILTEIYYDRYIFDDGFGMYFWNSVDDDVDFEIVKPQEILISPGAVSIDDAEYVVVEKWRNKKYFQDNYPELVKDISFSDSSEIQPDEYQPETTSLKNLAKVHYYFQDDIWIFKCGNKILEKKKNPHWEWRTAKEQAKAVKKRFKQIPTGWQPVRNHLTRPEKPVIQFKGYHLGGEFYSRSLMKQVIGLNVALNKRKCQIQDIVDSMGNPQWAVDPSVSQKQISLITSKPGLKIRISPSLIRSLPPQQPPTATFEDMLHSERKVEDMFGLHEMSMGAVARKRMTKAEATILKESDITPIRLLMRNSEVSMTKLINGFVQLMKLYYDRKHYIGALGVQGLETYGEYLVREEIPDNLSIMIKVGSTMPVSKDTRRAQYVRDFQMGAISLRDYLRLMEYPNPDELAGNVQSQMAGQYVPGQQQQPQQQGTQLKAPTVGEQV